MNAPLSIKASNKPINKNIVYADVVRRGTPFELGSYCNGQVNRAMDECGGSTIRKKLLMEPLVIADVSLKIILSRPYFKRLQLNPSSRDEVTFDQDYTSQIHTATRMSPNVQSTKEIAKICPERTCIEKYPPATIAITIPFKFHDITVVRAKP